MDRPIRVLSVYEGFFRGGARILHSSIISALHTRHDQSHTVFSIHSKVNRESTIQRMEDDRCYRHLRHCGIAVEALDRTVLDGKPPDTNFSGEELQQLQLAVDDSDVILVLKEQSLPIVNQINTHGRPVVLCVHRSDPEHQGVGVEALQESLRRGVVTHVICNGAAGKAAYIAAGVPEYMLSVIKNGINLDKFMPSADQRQQIRDGLDITLEAPVITLAARYDAMKNVPLFLEAANEFLASNPSANFIMCGAGMSSDNMRLMADVRAAFKDNFNASRNIHFLGIRDDMPALYAASDIVAITSSYGETYCLCLLEGMATGAVPVATDVGDTVEIVADRGIVTTSTALSVSQGWQKAFSNLAEFQKAIARDRPLFDESHPVKAYSNLLNGLHAQQEPLRMPSKNIFLDDAMPGFANLA